jgi:acyl-CoA synthetase (AMP-forming)/AMP-acid ligase II
MAPDSPPGDPDLAATTNLLQLVTAGADRFGGHPYLLPAEGEGRCVSFEDVLTFTRGCAALLAEHGVSPAGRVAVILHNSALAPLLFIGIIAAQRTLVPLNPKTSPGELEALLAHAKAELVIGHRERLAAAADRDPHWITVADAETMLADILARGAAYQGELSVPDGDGLLDAEIVYTSGSTGTPKGVVLSHRSLLANSLAMVRWADAGQDDVFLNVVPMFHAGGQGFPTLTPLWCGGRTVCVRSETALARFWRYVDRHQPTWTLVVNAYLASLTDRPERPASRSLKAVLAGGSALGTELIRRFEDTFGIPVRQVYGMTEMTSLTTAEERDRDPGGVRTAGPPVPFAKIRIVDPDGKDRPAGADGEILLSGPSIFTRYEGEQGLTAGKLVDGWVRSGDLGHLDEHGRLSVVDRIDSMVIVSGENVYPAEIENLVPRLVGIQDAVVVAVPHPVTGVELVLVHTLLPGAPADHDAWRATLMEHLGGFKVPRRFVALDEIGVGAFPRTPVGKIQRAEVQRLAVDRLA